MKRFWDKVNKTDSCWLWIGAKNNKGYPQFRINGQTFYAHRLSYEMEKGEIEKGKYILHRCDTPLCVRPAHLFKGTQKDNMQDCKAKGRGNHGENNYHAKLTRKKVAEIRTRRLRGEKVGDLAEEFGVHRMTVSRILNGKTWA